ncbi:unnamed protein product [Tuber melanosporum]|uniref:(Perigord truffle) hypothetical protein n=1 Tax=Tuber melanosporum (strain Mel28) TaxID=656061 RepID=D5G9S0_TUBMM|nr:uncharacterized protein GSTUM_00005045001 [Tuber melanosporum]CAZ81263.1 unnamed protein product [Tuber melanosporum]
MHGPTETGRKAILDPRPGNIARGAGGWPYAAWWMEGGKVMVLGGSCRTVWYSTVFQRIILFGRPRKRAKVADQTPPPRETGNLLPDKFLRVGKRVSNSNMYDIIIQGTPRNIMNRLEFMFFLGDGWFLVSILGRNQLGKNMYLSQSVNRYRSL